MRASSSESVHLSIECSVQFVITSGMHAARTSTQRSSLLQSNNIFFSRSWLQGKTVNTHPLKSSFTRLQQLHSFKLTRQQLLYPVSYLLKPGLRSVCVSVLFLVVSGAWFLNLCLVSGGGGGCFLSCAPRLRARVSFLILRNGRSRVSFLIIIFLNRWGGV